MGRTACIASVLGLFLGTMSAPSGGQNLPAPVLTPAHVVLPPVPPLQLNWPIKPLSFSFSAYELNTYAGPLQLYRAEALWLDTPAHKLLSAGTAELAYELDCRVTCQPVLKHDLDLEARMPLPALGDSAPKNYAFVRSSRFYTNQLGRGTGQLLAGFGSALSF